MQMRRKPNRLCQVCTGYVCGEGNIKNIMLIRRAECGGRQEAMFDNKAYYQMSARAFW